MSANGKQEYRLPLREACQEIWNLYCEQVPEALCEDGTFNRNELALWIAQIGRFVEYFVDCDDLDRDVILDAFVRLSDVEPREAERYMLFERVMDAIHEDGGPEA